MTMLKKYEELISFIDSRVSMGRTGYDWERRGWWNNFKKEVILMEKFIDELDTKGVIKWDGESWVIPIKS